MSLYGRSLLTLMDFSKDEIKEMLDTAAKLKYEKKNGISHEVLKGKNIVLLFEKDSTRTRCAFEVACHDLGMNPVYIGSSGSQMGKKESIKDTARVLGRMFDGIEYRGFSQDIVETLKDYSNVPVWNGLTNEFHPTQVLADLLTIREEKGYLEGLKIVYFGDARYNMGNSLMVGASKMGMNFVACAPKELWPNKELVDKCNLFAKESKGSIMLTKDVYDAIKDADIVVTDVWVSMGEDDNVWEERIKLLKPYQVNSELMDKAKEDAIFLHCLPSFHNLETKVGMEVYKKFNENGLEVTEDVFEGPKSRVFDEAENRLHTIKAVMYLSLYKG